MSDENLTQVLDTVKESAHDAHRKISLGRIASDMSDDSLALLLLVPAIIMLLPIGYIPGVSAVCGGLILVVAIQIALGRDQLWLPKKMKRIKLQPEKVEKTIDAMQPIAEKLDRISSQRFEIFQHTVWLRVMAVLSIVLSVPIIVIGFMPVLPMFWTAPILLFSVGLFAKDGLMIFAALVSASAVITSLPFLIFFWI